MYAYIKWVELVAAIIGVARWNSIKQHPLLKGLTIVVVFIASAEFIGYFIKFWGAYNTVFYNFLTEPVLFVLYGFAFYKGLKRPAGKTLTKWLGIIIISGYFISLLFVDYNKFLNVFGYNFGALYIATLSLSFIIEMIRYDDSDDYMEQPLIYLLICIFFYYLITIPHFSITYYFYFTKQTNIAVEILKYLNVIFNYLLYLAFAITLYLCPQKKL